MEQTPRRPVLTPPPAKAKPDLTPPSAPRTMMQKPPSRGSRAWFFLALAVVTLGAIGVVVMLPQLVNRPARTTSTVQPGTTSERSISQGKESNEPPAAVKVKAEALLRTILEQQARLEVKGVKTWGKETLVTSYPAALAKIADGNSYLDSGRFELAAKSYSESLSLLKQLETSRPDRLQRALRSGAQSLDQLDGQTARTQFEMALVLDPGNASATRGLKRAKSLKEVTERVRQGQAYESKGDLDRARKEYAAAIAIDGDNRPARDHLQRVDQLLAKGKYRNTITAASAALEGKDYERSQAFLDQAAKLHPNAPEVQRLSQKLREAKQVAALREARLTATRHEEARRWNLALKAYERALAVDPHATFALLGKKRAGKYVGLEQQVDSFLANPERLQSADPLAQAQRLVDVSKGMTKIGAELGAKLERLGSLVTDFSTPRSVVFRSDELTEVTLYRVARFGRFSERRMMLRPGQYTAVGSRIGYRDVQVRFRVPATDEETVIVVRCEERI